MNCKQSSLLIQMMVDGELEYHGRRSLNEHLRVCPACTEELRERTRMVQSVRVALRYRAESQIREIDVQQDRSAPALRLRTSFGQRVWTRRLVYLALGVVVAAAGAVVLAPLRPRPETLDAEVTLRNVIRALRDAQSLRIVSRDGKYATRDGKTSVGLSPTTVEEWRGRYGFYSISIGEDGERFAADHTSTGWNTTTREAWVYEPETRILHTVELDEETAHIIGLGQRQRDPDVYAIPLQTWRSLPETAKSAKMVSRGAREVIELVMDQSRPTGVVNRTVLDIDPTNHHILSRHSYVRADASGWMLCGAIEQVRYNPRLPATVLSPKLPPDTIRRPAKIAVVTNRQSKVLALFSEDDRFLYRIAELAKDTQIPEGIEVINRRGTRALSEPNRMKTSPEHVSAEGRPMTDTPPHIIEGIAASARTPRGAVRRAPVDSLPSLAGRANPRGALDSMGDAAADDRSESERLRLMIGRIGKREPGPLRTDPKSSKKTASPTRPAQPDPNTPKDPSKSDAEADSVSTPVIRHLRRPKVDPFVAPPLEPNAGGRRSE